MSTGKAAKDEHRAKAAPAPALHGQWALSMAAGRAEGMPLQSMSTFVLPGVHTGLMPSLSKETAELTPCSRGHHKSICNERAEVYTMALTHSVMRRGLGSNALCVHTGHCELDQEDRTSWARVRSEISL